MGFLRQFLILTIIMLTTTGGACADEVLRYAGATTLQRFFMPEATSLFTSDTAIKVRIEGGNTGPGIKALLNDEIEMAGAGRLLTAAEKSQGLVEHFLGWDVLTIVVHEQNLLKLAQQRTPETIRSIFLHKVLQMTNQHARKEIQYSLLIRGSVNHLQYR